MKRNILPKQRGILLALLSFLCLTSIKAQTWTPPTFEHATNDLSTHVGEVFYLYNVGLNAYVTYGAEYGTRSVMGPVGYPMYLRASGSNYKFEFVTSSKHNGVTYDLFDAGSGTVYTDNTTNSDWTCTYDATSKSYTVANTVASTKYLAPSSTTYSNSSNPGNGFKTGGKYYILWDNIATNDNYAKWRFVTPKQKALLDLSNLFTYVTNNPSLGIDLTSYVDIYNNSASTTTDLTTDLTNLKNAIYATATTSNPVEITSFAIANPSFEFKSSGSMDSWVVTAAITAGLQPQYNTTFSSGSSGSVEYYKSSGDIPAFTIQQTINSLPVGKYSLNTILTGAAVSSTSPANIKLFVGSYNTSITTTPTPTPAIYSVQNILCDGSALNIGLQYTIGASWLAADYFKLYYYGPITSSTTWNSSTSTWSNGTPTADVNAVIPSSNTYNGPGFTCYSLDVEEATTFTSAATINSNLTLNNTLTVSGANTLTINSTVSGSSTITATTGTVAYAGSSAQTISNLNGGAVYNLTVNNAAGATLGASTIVSGTLTLTSGNLTTGANTLTLTAGTPTSGSGYIVTGSTGTVVYAGSSAQTISNLNGTVNNLTVSNAITATVSGVITINGDLNLSTATTRLAVSANVTLNGDMTGSGYIDGGSASYSMSCSGSSQQHLSAINLYNLTINNPAGVILGRDLTFMSKTASQNLTLQAGQFDNSTFILTLCNNCTVVRTAGSLTSAPTFGASVKLLYNESSAQTTGTEIPVATGVLTDMTVSNSAGVTLNSNAKVNGILTISSGAALSVAAGKQLTATSTLTNSGTLNLLSTSDGTATILTPASIGGTGGTVNVQQYLTGADADATPGVPDGRYWYLTSPVVGATSSIFTPSATANRLWSYNEAGASSAEVYIPITVGTDVLTAGKGYVTRLTGNATVNFAGALVNGTTTIGLTNTPTSGKPGFNLIGNPYPSYLNIRSAFNAVAVMEKGIWYRSSVGDLMGFDTYNIDDSTQVKHDGGTTELSSLVPPMQAFWVKATASGTITLSNAMRANKVSGNLLRSSNAEMQKIRLIVSNGVRSDETLLGFYSDASDAFDNHDSRKMFNGVASLPELFTLAGSTEVAINGLSPLVDDKEIILGFNTMQAGTFTIKASEVLNMEEGQTVILKDKLLNVTQNLTETPEYGFTSTVTNTTDRFSLVIGKVATALATVNNPVFAVCTTNGNMLEVALSGVNTNAARITVFNALGQELASFKASGSKTVIGKHFESGVYMVKVVAPGFQATRKMIINN